MELASKLQDSFTLTKGCFTKTTKTIEGSIKFNVSSENMLAIMEVYTDEQILIMIGRQVSELLKNASKMRIK